MPYRMYGAKTAIPSRSTLNTLWSDAGGLVPALYRDVTYKPVTIILNKPVLDEVYLPQLGFTQSNPRYFWIEGQ